MAGTNRKRTVHEDDALENSRTARTPEAVFIERPFSTSSDKHPVNGNYAPIDEEEEVEEDLILGDEDELEGDEEEFEVELDEDIDEDDIDEDDLVIDTDEGDDDEDL